MLRIAEVEAGTRRACFAEFSLETLLAMLAESYEPSFAAAGITLHTKIASGLKFQGDRELLAQFFTNLLDNIILHASGAANATITAAASGARMIVTIADDGCGVPAAQREKIFQRFVRMDAARNRPGHGLGLPLARAIAALHDADIVLEDNSTGLKVSVRL